MRFFNLLLVSSAALCVVAGFDWTQCVSEGGSENCAKCESAGGALPCSEITEAETSNVGALESECPDSNIVTGRKVFVQNAISGGGMCNTFTMGAFLRSAVWTTWQFPGVGSPEKPNDGSGMVVTKGGVFHPHMASKNIGAFALKRVVTHLCSSGAKPPDQGGCVQGTTVADTMKMGYCVKCPSNFFAKVFQNAATDEELKDFVNNCVSEAFNSDGSQKDDYKCEGEDAAKALAGQVAF